MIWNNVRGRALIGAQPIVAARGAPTAPTLVTKQTTGTLGASNTYASTGSAPAGSVAVAVLMTQGATPTSFTDSVDPGTPWTTVGPTNNSTLHFIILKRIVPAGGFSPSTTFTVNWDFAGAPSSALIVSCFASGNAIPTATDGYDAGGLSGNISETVPGTTSPTSYQLAAISSTVDAGTTYTTADGWQLDQDATTTTGYGMRTYWRKATTAGGSTTINSTFGGFAAYIGGWVEVGSP